MGFGMFLVYTNKHQPKGTNFKVIWLPKGNQAICLARRGKHDGVVDYI